MIIIKPQRLEKGSGDVAKIIIIGHYGRGEREAVESAKAQEMLIEKIKSMEDVDLLWLINDFITALITK